MELMGQESTKVHAIRAFVNRFTSGRPSVSRFTSQSFQGLFVAPW